MKEAKTTYAYLIEHMNEPSFEKVRDIACDFVQKLPSDLVDELHDMLNRGVDILDSEPLMQMYFYSYGCMHAEKLTFAFQNLSKYIKSAKEINLIDYGSGQGLATMCYHDFIMSNGLLQQVRSIKLIEPSSVALARAELLCSCFFPNAVITPIQKSFDDLLVTDIKEERDIPTLHLFSNVLDVESYNTKALSDIIRNSCDGDNEFVIVSPMQNARRTRRIKEFVETLEVNCYLEKYLDKQQLREDKDWTCLAFLCSTRNEKLASINLDDVYTKVDDLFEDVLKRRDNEYSKQVFDEAKFCADNGDAKCMNAIGRCYNSGIVVQKDHEESLRWFKMASRNGYVYATCNLALAHAKGRGVKKNHEKAIEIANELQNINSMLFNAVLGEIYRYDNNNILAFDHYKNAAKLGDAKSEFYYGVYLYEGKVCEHNKKLGAKYIQSAATKGVKAANFIMARLYEFGAEDAGVKQSDSLAVKNYEASAIKGNKKAQLKLAEIYKNGLLGVDKNLRESFKWYLFIAEGGEISVSFEVAYAYDSGNGTDVNYEEAVKWYKIAADNGSVAAMNNLAICYEKGKGVVQNLETAFSLYFKSASQGNLVASNNLSICYQNGIGTKANPTEAFIWKEKVAKGNNSQAQRTLGEWYFKGYGTQRNYENALYWFVKSKLEKGEKCICIENLLDFIIQKANDGNALFEYLLAKCYTYGVFVPKDQSLSVMWYEKSAANGFVESLIKLRRIDSISTKATEEERSAGVKDEYGVMYSQDGKKVLSCSYVNCKSYKLRKGTRIICDGAFGNQHIEQLIIPTSIVAIGDNPFASDSYYHDKKIAIKNQSPCFMIDGDALYTKDGQTIVAYWGKQKQFTLPDQVKHIANGCFSNVSNLEEILMTQSVVSIGHRAFEDCYSLKSLDLPKSVKFIGEYAFWGCKALEEIWSLGSVRTIEQGTFKGCNLKYVHLSSFLVSIKDNAFNSNRELRCIDLPDTLETIGNYAFAYCSNLERINLGNSVKSIGDLCFYRCAIQEVRIPSSIKNLGIRPFDKVTNIITGYNGRYKAERGMLINEGTKNLEFYFGDSTFITLEGIKSISPLAFYESGVVEVVIHKDITSLSEYVFYNSESLASITLPDGLEFIGTGTFYGCTKLCNISIPKTVHEICRGAFGECVSLDMIEFKGIATKASESIFEDINCDLLPLSYRDHGMLPGCCLPLIDGDEPDVESFKCISIVVPKSAKNKYTFETICYTKWPRYGMDRRFNIIEKDEDC